MIQVQTILNVADNSGVKKVMCIKVLGGSKRRYAYVTDIIICSVKETISTSKISKGAIVKAVIVRTAKEIRRKDDPTSIHSDICRYKRLISGKHSKIIRRFYRHMSVETSYSVSYSRNQNWSFSSALTNFSMILDNIKTSRPVLFRISRIIENLAIVDENAQF